MSGPSQEFVRQWLDYDPATGVFRMRRRSGTRGRCGHVVGWVDPSGYKRISIHKKRYYAHRLAMIYMDGFAGPTVDHINGDTEDNRYTNLRNVTRAQNARNRISRNRLPGVIPGSRGRFRTQITVRGKRLKLGIYMTQEAAHNAYLEAVQQYH